MDNNEEILQLLNRLLEELHQADGNHQGSAVFNIYEKGSMHVDHVENLNLNGDTNRKPLFNKDHGETPSLPDVLNTEEARVLWQKVIDVGWVDENFQPLLSRTQAAMLAYEMAKRLGIRNKWRIFEAFWNRKNMRGDYNDALNQRQTLAFQDSLKTLFAD